MPGAADTEAGDTEAGAGALALFGGHITIPIMGILTTPIIGPTITPIILTVIDGRPGCFSISDAMV